MREAVPFVLLACACGAAARTGASSGASASRRPTGPMLAAMEGEATTEFDSIEARAAEVAPGLKEVARRKTTGAPVELYRAEQQDTCLRVAFESPVPVVGKLVDASGGVLAASHEPSTQGVLGEYGPVCVRRGDAVSAVADSAKATVRWVAWGAP